MKEDLGGLGIRLFVVLDGHGEVCRFALLQLFTKTTTSASSPVPVLALI